MVIGGNVTEERRMLIGGGQQRIQDSEQKTKDPTQ